VDFQGEGEVLVAEAQVGAGKVKRSRHPNLFFSKKEGRKIVAAIREAEKHTSGEIRVHLVAKAKGDILFQAKEIFEKIGMARTQERNGVLIFLAPQNRQFVVLGDVAIHEKVPAGFWENIAHSMEKYFGEDHFADGIIEAIKKSGEELKKHFPHEGTDVNELSDKISYSW